MSKSDLFMNWWRSVNDVLRSRGQPDMLYGDARDFFADFYNRQ